MFIVLKDYLIISNVDSMRFIDFRKTLIRFFILILALGVISGISIGLMFTGTTYYDYNDSDWDNFYYTPRYNESNWNLLLDSHSHTHFSDGSLTPRQNILWHISLGYEAIVITDHNTFTGAEEALEIARIEFNDTIKVLIGVEWTTARCHLDLILPPNATKENYSKLLDQRKGITYTPSDEEMQSIINNTHTLGGLVVVNHFLWSAEYLNNHPTRQQYLDWGVDYIEIINESAPDSTSVDFCLNNSLGVITGTDMHQPGPVYSWTTLNVSEFSEEAIFTELKERRTHYIYNGFSSPYEVEHKIDPIYITLYPLIKIGEMFDEMYRREIYRVQFIVFLLYVIGGFIFTELIRLMFRLLKWRFKKRKKLKT
ncbi:MAG: PHP domain-containing protein [Candidatus Heimdallarchaeota archaeon]|nr:PHP domain-containing protein [Candidatus Heimdallarchaeota archaeon]